MHILHHGATRGVTGSCHQLQGDANNSILIDCGLFQGAETSGSGRGESALEIEFPLDTVQALIVTHVHIDHVGRIPYLLAKGFKGPIYCTKASAILLPLVLEDALKVGFTRDNKLIQQVMQQLRRQIHAVAYDTDLAIALQQNSEPLCVRFQVAGHILGSAYVECEHNGQTVLFSGDLGVPDTPLLPDPAVSRGCDILVLESTYGDRRHDDRSTRTQKLKQILEHCLKDQGSILIPAFSIGRTQELLYEIEGIIHDSANEFAAKGLQWKDLDVVVDSPLANQFTGYYQQLSGYWDDEARQRRATGRHPLDFSQLLTVNEHAQHLEVVDYLKKSGRPAIVIAAGGMCNGGRIVNYLKALIEDPRTEILFCGYQAQGTLGRDIQTAKPGSQIRIDRENYTLNAQHYTLSGYSAHADQQNLLDFVLKMPKKPRKIILVHGDSAAKQTLKNQLQQVLDCDISIPD